MVFNTEHFSTISDVYDSRSSLANNQKMKKYLQDNTSHIRSCRVLDLGVGTGGFSKILNVNNSLFGVDRNLAMLNLAEKIGVSCVCADLGSLPFRNNTFDVALCRQVFQYLSRQEILELLLETYNVLSFKGSLYLHHMVPIEKAHGHVLKEFMKVKGNTHPYLTHEEIINSGIKAGFHLQQDKKAVFSTEENIGTFMKYRDISKEEFKRRYDLINSYGANETSIDGETLSYSNLYSFVELKKNE